MKNYPTPWQRKTMWAALSAFFVVCLAVIIGGVIWIGANVMGFLQPILIPVAIAAILAYLLDPLVTRLSFALRGRLQAIALIFLITFVALGGLLGWLVPTISMQSANFARELPDYTQKARDYVVDIVLRYNRTFGPAETAHEKHPSSTANLISWLLGATPQPAPTATPAAAPKNVPISGEVIAPSPSKISSADRQRIQAWVEKQMPNLERYVPALSEKFWNILQKSIGGFLGITGFLLSLILVPIYLFFFLKESPRIARSWKEYLPLRASPLKDEVADVLAQINHYIIAYFRG